jgi:Ca2+-binding RTX toxin-like protein
VNRHLSTVLAAGLLAVAVLPQAVSAENAAVGDLTGNVDLTVANVITGGVAITSPTTATLTATVDPNTVGTSYYFEYGPNGNLSLRTPTVSAGAGLQPFDTSANILGLEPGAIYDYRIVSSSPGGELSVGKALSFQTGPASGTSAGKGKKSRCTIRGTSKRDSLKGTRKRDVICGLGGRDKIRGLGGNDVIRGGKGNDRIKAGSGRDRVYGNTGNDALFGQSGRDRLYGGKGRDKVVGGSGRDSAKVDRRDILRSVERSSRH